MAEFDFKEEFLRLVQAMIKDLKALDDPDCLVKPLAEALVQFRNAVINGEAMNSEPTIRRVWDRLSKILMYHSPHFVGEDWFQEMVGMVEQDCQETQQQLRRLAKRKS